ncbi:sugar kinase [Salegentibacter salegens]|uniref:2-dehydro-3-deoxygluconokinase n=1 Tax=Salegentibacter salegens TaxID=143223 RepID=A0A1M7N5N2_9FLAO|nr:sugar kinase [Salegentibacter salegens]PRX46873.1 2-dehydro-3-deoxygluconokinase [Salegentibacter salegens]SHM98893.1 2-dehydro-3-deoxygluconokinase [Salegentibacter salegens]
MKKLVSLGELLMRLSCEDALRFSQVNNFKVAYGGSEANVLITAANFGLETEFLSVLPENDLGKSALNDLRNSNVGLNHIKFQGERLGLYFLEPGAINRPGKIIYDRQNSAFSKIDPEWFDWEEIFKDCNWFHWSGITPAISEKAAQVCLHAVETAKSKGIKVSGDLNYRGNLWQYEGANPKEIMSQLVDKTDVLLAGSYACSQFFDIKNIQNNSELSKALIQKFPALQRIAITNREEINASHHKWSADLFTESTLLSSTEYNIYPIVDRVGTGDSFMGALIYGLQHFKDQKALDFATAASCLKHSIVGDFNRVSKEEVFELIEGDGSGRIKR